VLSNDTSKNGAPDPWDIGFGVVVFLGSLLALFVWFPADIPTGFFFINAIGREEPGDSFFPIMLAVLLLILSIIQLGLAVFRARPANEDGTPTPTLTLSNFKFLFLFVVISMVGYAIMYGLGPLTVAVLNSVGLLDADYRQLTDTAPYKYIGYVVGGFLMTITLIAWTEGRIRRQSVIAVVLTLIVAIIIFDVVLKNVLLPPNADY
jgi:hypothetical protein